MWNHRFHYHTGLQNLFIINFYGGEHPNRNLIRLENILNIIPYK